MIVERFLVLLEVLIYWSSLRWWWSEDLLLLLGLWESLRWLVKLLVSKNILLLIKLRLLVMHRDWSWWLLLNRLWCLVDWLWWCLVDLLWCLVVLARVERL